MPGKRLVLGFLTLLALLTAGEVACRLIDAYADRAALSAGGEWADLPALNYNEAKALPRRGTPGEFRILTFGDSYCCATVKPPYTIQGAAAKALAEAGVRVRLVNFGEPGTSFAQYRQALAHWAGRIEADAVLVVVFLGNDCQEAAWGAVPEGQGVNALLRTCPVEIATDRKRLTAVPRLYGSRLADYVRALGDYALSGGLVTMDVPEPFSMLYGPLPQEAYLRQEADFAAAGQTGRCGELTRGWQALAGLGRDLSRLGRERGIPTVVVLAPPEVALRPGLWREAAQASGADPASYDPWRAGRMARAVLAGVAPEVGVLDLTPAFACAAGRGDVLYPPREIHWNVAGNRLAGLAVARFVGRGWLQLPGAGLPGGDSCLDAVAPEADGAAVEACLTAAGPFGKGPAGLADRP
jgi:hypothetical protein